MKFGKESTIGSSIVGKRAVSRVDNLCFYDSLTWQDKDVAGTLDAGLESTIDESVIKQTE